MEYKNGHELLIEIRKIMALKKIQMKELAILMGRSQQSVSQIFKTANPKYSTLLEICTALEINLDISFIIKDKDDTE